MKVVAYVRTSIKTNQEENLRKQLEEIKAFISKKNWKLECVYADVGSGVSKNKNLRSMYEDAQQGKYDIIVATKPSRLFRSAELASKVNNLLQTSKVHIVTTDNKINTIENDDKLLSIYSFLCVQEFEMMSKRIKAGKKLSAKSNS